MQIIKNIEAGLSTNVTDVMITRQVRGGVLLQCCRLQLVVVLSYYFLSVAESDNPWPRQCSDECRDCSRELQRPAVTSDNDKLDTQQ